MATIMHAAGAVAAYGFWGVVATVVAAALILGGER